MKLRMVYYIITSLFGGTNMLAQNYVNDISNILVKQVSLLFGSKLQDVILFGSYARGEAYDCSDIDVMIIVDMDRTNLNKYKDDMCKISSDLGMQYNILISPVLQSANEFNKFKNDLPFYRNVFAEGQRLYVQ